MPARAPTQKPRPAARHTWHLLGSQYALSGWVGLVFGAPSLLSAALLIQGEGQGQWWQYIAFAALAWATPLAVLVVFRLLWLPVKPRASRPILTLVAFLTAGAVRGAVILCSEPLLGLHSWSNPVIRFISEVITIGAAFSVIAIEIAARLTYRDALRQVAQDREDLLELQMNAAVQFHAQREALLTEAQGILNPILDSLKGSLSFARDADTLASLSRRMRDVVDDTVRPLSASIAKRSPSVERSGRLVPHRSSRVRRATESIELGQFVLPLTVTMFMVITTAAPLLIVCGWVVSVQALELMIISLYVALWVMRLVTLHLVITPGWGTMLFCVLHAFAGGVFILLLESAHVSINPVLLGGWILLLRGVAYLLVQYQHVEWVRSDVIHTQAEVNAELDVVLSSLRQQLRVESKRVATILHGPVQTALYAAAIRITSQEIIDPKVASRAMTDLETAMAQLESDPITSQALEDFVAEIARVWGSSISILFEQDEKARKAIAENPTALACVIEVVREGVNNAIKHAQATSVEIEVFMVDSRLVEVTVTNAGTLLNQPNSTGFGADVLSDLTHDWTLTDSGTLTTLWAAVALDHVD
jgi:two-component sensor histidine kinase